MPLNIPLIGWICFASSIILIIVLCICLSTRHIKKRITLEQGEFHIAGKKNSFTIKKDDRFVFQVQDGKIISVKDKQFGNKFILYDEVNIDAAIDNRTDNTTNNTGA